MHARNYCTAIQFHGRAEPVMSAVVEALAYMMVIASVVEVAPSNRIQVSRLEGGVTNTLYPEATPVAVQLAVVLAVLVAVVVMLQVPTRTLVIEVPLLPTVRPPTALSPPPTLSTPEIVEEAAANEVEVALTSVVAPFRVAPPLAFRTPPTLSTPETVEDAVAKEVEVAATSVVPPVTESVPSVWILVLIVVAAATNVAPSVIPPRSESPTSTALRTFAQR